MTFKIIANIGIAFLIAPLTLSAGQKITIFDEGNLRKFDQNSTLGEEKLTWGNLVNPLSAKTFKDSGNANDGYYRGITSKNKGESDIYFFTEDDNTFVRMGNFNGSDSSIETRMSLYYYDIETNIPKNMVNTSKVNVSFNYRFYASDIEELGFNESTLIIQVQTRGSANGKSGNVYLRDLKINEIGDDTWQTYSLTLETDSGMSTNYAWFHFFYYDIKKDIFPTYFIDIDNLFMSNNEVNLMPYNGNFEREKSSDNSFPTSINNDYFYKDIYYKKYLGDSPKVVSLDNKRVIEMKSKYQKSTFSILKKVNKEKDLFRLSFKYKNKSYYEDPNISIYIKGLSEKRLKVNLDNDISYEGFSSYSLKRAEFCEEIIYFKAENDGAINLDFIVDVDNYILISELSLKEVDSINLTMGNYNDYLNELSKIEKDFKLVFDSYFIVDQNRILKAIEKAKEINEYSSQALMNEKLNSLKELIRNTDKKSDLSALKELIERVFIALEGKEKDDFEKASYIKLYQALDKAIKMKESNTQEEVDNAYEELLFAFNNLKEAL